MAKSAAKSNLAITTPDSPRDKRSSAISFGSNTVTVLVGQAETPFTVHKDLLTSSSKFFKNAFEGSFQESNSQTTKLLDGHAPTFNIYLTWLYSSGRMCTASDKKDTRAAVDDEWPILAECAILGDLVQDDKFYNAAVDTLVDIIVNGTLYPSGLAEKLYDNLPPGSPILKLIVDIWIYGANASWLDSKDLSSGPVEFMQALTKGLIEKAERGSDENKKLPWVTNRCQYHKHIEGEARCSR